MLKQFKTFLNHQPVLIFNHSSLASNPVLGAGSDQGGWHLHCEVGWSWWRPWGIRGRPQGLLLRWTSRVAGCESPLSAAGKMKSWKQPWSCQLVISGHMWSLAIMVTCRVQLCLCTMVSSHRFEGVVIPGVRRLTVVGTSFYIDVSEYN